MNSDTQTQSTEIVEDTEFQQMILAGLNNLNKHIYQGTVDPDVKAKRRAKNKVAKASRKRNRG